MVSYITTRWKIRTPSGDVLGDDDRHLAMKSEISRVLSDLSWTLRAVITIKGALFKEKSKEATSLTFHILAKRSDVKKIFWPSFMIVPPFYYDRYTFLLVTIDLRLQIDFVAGNSGYRLE